MSPRCNERVLGCVRRVRVIQEDRPGQTVVAPSEEVEVDSGEPTVILADRRARRTSASSGDVAACCAAARVSTDVPLSCRAQKAVTLAFLAPDQTVFLEGQGLSWHGFRQTLWVVIRCTSAVASRTDVVAGAGAR